MEDIMRELSAEEIHQKLKEGYEDILAGNVQDVSEAFRKFREDTEKEQGCYGKNSIQED